MATKSFYEGGNSRKRGLSSGFALARIVKVDPDNRLCDVKTFFGSNPDLEDLSLSKVQWLNTDSHPSGDESTSIPRENSYGLVFFVQSQALIWGFMTPTTADAKPPGKIAEKVNTGSKVLKTVGENKIILHSHGEIEIQATNSCRTFMLPNEHVINTLCQNYEFHCNGGYTIWRDDDDHTLYNREYRDSILRVGVIQEKKGYVSSDTLWQTKLGAGIPGIPGSDILPQWEFEVGRIGKTTLKIHTPGPAIGGFNAELNPSGAFTIKAGVTQFKFDVSAAGETTIDVNNVGNITISPIGNITVKAGAGKIEMTALGNVTVSGATGITLDSKMDVTVKSLTGITLSSLGGIKLDGTGLGGSGAIGKVLVFPLALSDFTGLPIQVGSSTVQASP